MARPTCARNAAISSARRSSWSGALRVHSTSARSASPPSASKSAARTSSNGRCCGPRRRPPSVHTIRAQAHADAAPSVPLCTTTHARPCAQARSRHPAASCHPAPARSLIRRARTTCRTASTSCGTARAETAIIAPTHTHRSHPMQRVATHLPTWDGAIRAPPARTGTPKRHPTRPRARPPRQQVRCLCATTTTHRTKSDRRPLPSRTTLSSWERTSPTSLTTKRRTRPTTRSRRQVTPRTSPR